MEWQVNGKRIKIVEMKKIFGNNQVFYTIEGKVNKTGPRKGQLTKHRMMLKSFLDMVGAKECVNNVGKNLEAHK